MLSVIITAIIFVVGLVILLKIDDDSIIGIVGVVADNLTGEEKKDEA